MGPQFSYLTLVASASATACFIIALAHLSLWLRGLYQREHVLCSLMTLGAGCVILIELALVLAVDIASAEFLLRQFHLALFVTIMSLIAFVHVYLNAGSRWLIWIIGLLWSITLIADITISGSFSHTRIGALLAYETFWGEPYTLAVGQMTSWKYVTDVASVLICVFLLHAMLAAWRNGRRQRAVLVGGSSFAFIVIAGILVPLQDAGIVKFPLITSAAFLAIVIALAVQLIDEAFRANASRLEVEQLRRAMILGEMVGGLAHEINQPLAAILSNAQAASRFMKADNVDLDEIREIIDDIIADEKRASGFIRSLRQMLERKEHEIVSADVNAIVKSAARIMAGELHTHDVTLYMELQPALDSARVDPLQIQQVLINLLLNAVRATAALPRQRREVTIQTSRYEQGVEVVVLDRGPGIRGEQKTMLFEAFVSRSKGGLGMGLAICKRIVERFGGNIWVEDRAGGGTIFRFTLPLAEPGN